jgi:hypothetical protein
LTCSLRVGDYGSVCFKVDVAKKYALFTWRINLGHKILGNYGVDHGSYLFPQIKVS